MLQFANPAAAPRHPEAPSGIIRNVQTLEVAAENIQTEWAIVEEDGGLRLLSIPNA